MVDGHADKDLGSARLGFDGRSIIIGGVAGCAFDAGWGGGDVADEFVGGVVESLLVGAWVLALWEIAAAVGLVEFVGPGQDCVPHVLGSEAVAFDADDVEAVLL